MSWSIVLADNVGVGAPIHKGMLFRALLLK